MLKLACDLVKRGTEHDDSKFGPEELPVYASDINNYGKHRIGTPEYEKARKKIAHAIKHHIEHPQSRHHPEHFKGGVEDMNLVDLLEMVCDWKSATLNHPENPGDMNRSLKVGESKYKISPQLVKVLYNTMRDYDLL